MSLETVSTKKFDQIRFLIMNGFIATYFPLDLYMFEVDNWFDSKWLNFSGKTLGALGLWKGETTIPPFNPNRIMRYARFERAKNNDEEFYNKLSSPDHIHVSQPSGENLNRKITQFSNDGMFIWFNGNAENNGFGSIMIYIIKEKEIRQLYICLKDNKKKSDQDSNWIIHSKIGLTPTELDNVIEKGKINRLWNKNEL